MEGAARLSLPSRSRASFRYGRGGGGGGGANPSDVSPSAAAYPSGITSAGRAMFAPRPLAPAAATVPSSSPGSSSSNSGNHLPPGVGQIHLSSTGQLSTLAFAYPLKLISPTPLASSTRALRVVYLLSYGGGLVGGDRVWLDVNVEQAAKLVLLTQVRPFPPAPPCRPLIKQKRAFVEPLISFLCVIRRGRPKSSVHARPRGLRPPPPQRTVTSPRPTSKRRRPASSLSPISRRRPASSSSRARPRASPGRGSPSARGSTCPSAARPRSSCSTGSTLAGRPRPRPAPSARQAPA